MRSDHESFKQTKNYEPNTIGRDNRMSDIPIATGNHQYVVDGGFSKTIYRNLWKSHCSI